MGSSARNIQTAERPLESFLDASLYILPAPKKMASSVSFFLLFLSLTYRPQNNRCFVDSQFVENRNILQDHSNLLFNLIAIRVHILPNILIVPLSYFKSASIQLIAVVLPEPLGPRRPNISLPQFLDSGDQGPEALHSVYQIFF